MKPLKELEGLKEELEDKVDELEKEVREKLDEKEIQRIEKGPGLRKFPGNTREQHLLYFYTLRIEDIEKALKQMRNLEKEKIREKTEELKQKSGENITENSEKSDRYSQAARGLERALKAIEGEELENFLEIKYETSNFYEQPEKKNEILSEQREKASHTFLQASGLLGEKIPYKRQLESLKGIKSEDLEEADKYTEKIEEIREELRKRAEIIDQSIKRASFNVSEPEK